MEETDHELAEFDAAWEALNVCIYIGHAGASMRFDLSPKNSSKNE
jgi:hypothetical protein